MTLALVVPAQTGKRVAVNHTDAPKKRPLADAVDIQQVMSIAEAAALVSAPPPRAGGAALPAAAPAPVALTTFEGGADNNIGIPPDTPGAVGPNHVFPSQQ